jgi:hypothetical protein
MHIDESHEISIFIKLVDFSNYLKNSEKPRSQRQASLFQRTPLKTGTTSLCNAL